MRKLSGSPFRMGRCREWDRVSWDGRSGRRAWCRAGPWQIRILFASPTSDYCPAKNPIRVGPTNPKLEMNFKFTFVYIKVFNFFSSSPAADEMLCNAKKEKKKRQWKKKLCFACSQSQMNSGLTAFGILYDFRSLGTEHYLPALNVATRKKINLLMLLSLELRQFNINHALPGRQRTLPKKNNRK